MLGGGRRDRPAGGGGGRRPSVPRGADGRPGGMHC